MKKRGIAILLTAILALSIVACGGGGTTTREDSGAASGGVQAEQLPEEAATR